MFSVARSRRMSLAPCRRRRSRRCSAFRWAICSPASSAKACCRTRRPGPRRPAGCQRRNVVSILPYADTPRGVQFVGVSCPVASYPVEPCSTWHAYQAHCISSTDTGTRRVRWRLRRRWPRESAPPVSSATLPATARCVARPGEIDVLAGIRVVVVQALLHVSLGRRRGLPSRLLGGHRGISVLRRAQAAARDELRHLEIYSRCASPRFCGRAAAGSCAPAWRQAPALRRL